ncbi:hypothetical protein [Cupriavidus sp. CuC1]|uniref:hypothetical protein n=1 Tax=Cupriavidus sp. CuC1 TaxID=3373131 RepID=UPI0037D87490
MTQLQDPRLGACVYLLHLLLQRAEQREPGSLDDLLRGVRADRAGLPPDIAGHDETLHVFDEALRMLSLANDQMKAAGRAGS